MFKKLQEGPVLLEQSESQGKRALILVLEVGRGADGRGPYRLFVKILTSFFSKRNGILRGF